MKTVIYVPKTFSNVLSHVVQVQCLNFMSLYTTFSPALETQAGCVDHSGFNLWSIPSLGVWASLPHRPITVKQRVRMWCSTLAQGMFYTFLQAHTMRT